MGTTNAHQRKLCRFVVTGEKNCLVQAVSWLAVLFFLAALSASAHVPSSPETRVELPRDCAPLSIWAESELDAPTNAAAMATKINLAHGAASRL